MNNEKKVLVILNPLSGKGKSKNIFNKFIKNFLIEKDYDIKELNSKSLFNFKKIIEANTNYLNNTNLIVIMGGDGTLHHIINAIIKFSNNKNIPIALIPTGSGNGLFKSIIYENNRKYSILDSMKIIEENKIINGDIIKITTKNKSLYSCLAISWGFISDVDIKTEYLRKLGTLRFDLGAILFLIKKNSYYGTFIYEDCNNKEIKVEGNFFHFWACNSSWASANTFSSPFSKINDGYIYISYILLPISRCSLLNILLQMNNGNYIYNKNVNYIKTKKFKLKIKSGDIVIDGEHTKHNEIICKIDTKYPFLC